MTRVPLSEATIALSKQIKELHGKGGLFVANDNPKLKTDEKVTRVLHDFVTSAAKDFKKFLKTSEHVAVESFVLLGAPTGGAPVPDYYQLVVVRIGCVEHYFAVDEITGDSQYLGSRAIPTCTFA